jgi:hypothetical protein
MAKVKSSGYKLRRLLEQSPGLLPVALASAISAASMRNASRSGSLAEQAIHLLLGVVIAASLTQRQRVGIAFGAFTGCIALG